MKTSASAQGSMGATSWCCNRNPRASSPSAVSPGSRTVTSSDTRGRLRSAAAAAASCVDLPEPSIPSKDTKKPGRAMPLLLPVAVGFVRGRQDDETAVGIAAGAARVQLVLLDQLVLQTPHVGVLRRQLDLHARRLHPLDALPHLLHRRVRGIRSLDAVDP